VEYTDLVTSVIEAHNLRHSDSMTVRLLLSIDRSKSIDENAETLDIAVRVSSRDSVVIGVDFSGNPHNGRFDDFVSMLRICRDAGLFITVHAAEIEDSTRDDSIAFETVHQEVALNTGVLTFSASTFKASEMDDIAAFR
jgi:adenosine deaminase